MSIKIWPYKSGSKSARAIAQSIHKSGYNVKVLLPPAKSKWKPANGTVVINWGNASIDRHPAIQKTEKSLYILNHPDAVNTFSNKLLTFNAAVTRGLEDFIPPYTTRMQEAAGWPMTVCRTVLRGHSGEGIVIAEGGKGMQESPLYTRYLKKKSEWRLHFVNMGKGKTFFFLQQKKRNRDIPDERVNWKVRNYDNGFIYAVNGIDEVPPTLLNEVKRKVQHLTEGVLDFGSADLIFTSKDNPEGYQSKFVLLEVNTACGLESPTLLEFYREALEQLIQKKAA